jgi:hypothetical protein
LCNAASFHHGCPLTSHRLTPKFPFVKLLID